MTEENNDRGVDPKKLFDPKQYNTLFVKREGDTEGNEDKITNLINLLTDPANRENRIEALDLLRSNAAKAVPMLVEAIDKADKDRLPLLIAACWEAELNFSSYLTFFTDLALTEDYMTALEAITVIENMIGPFKPEEVSDLIKRSEAFLKNDASEKSSLVSELLITLKSLPV